MKKILICLIAAILLAIPGYAQRIPGSGRKPGSGHGTKQYPCCVSITWTFYPNPLDNKPMIDDMVIFSLNVSGLPGHYKAFSGLNGLIQNYSFTTVITREEFSFHTLTASINHGPFVNRMGQPALNQGYEGKDGLLGITISYK